MTALRPFTLARLDGTRATTNVGTVPACELTVEIVSFPTPSGTIMVRAIPGFPGTLIEVPLELLAPGSPTRTIVHYARIVPAPGAHSLAELLRRDRAVPVNFTLAGDVPELDAWGEEWPRGPLMIAGASGLSRELWQTAGWTLEIFGAEEVA